MTYDEMFARSFSRRDQIRLKYSAFAACFVVACCLCTVFKPYLGPLPALNLRLTMADGLQLAMITDKTGEPKRPYSEVQQTSLTCDISKHRSDTCEIKGDVRIKGTSSLIFVASSHNKNASFIIKPYARNGDKSAMDLVTTFTLKSVENQPEIMPECNKTHNVPAVVFSIGGYANNNFHAFTDVIIPLYATSRKFNGEVKFLVSNKLPRWTSKFKVVLDKLSRYETIDIDRENIVHCFPSMIVGLKKEHTKELHYESMKDFRNFLRNSYSLERSMVIKLNNSSIQKARLLIISRQKTRAFTNVEDVVLAAENMGFEVIVSEMSANMTHISRLVNSCDVLIGVHGAGLTNMVFLPENGVIIQVVPFGKMEWLASTYFGEPSKEMGLKYLEYKISEDESSLIQEYPLKHQVFVDPYSVQKKGWSAYKSIYLDKQNVKLNVTKFKETLSHALELLHV
ncbi:alpha-1,3-arabinosyltransferase XAT2-like [Rutidosis leptorrhynchoides]|uniref:alpha-1,3-arabinosyltransferase XAT2-like n=1 Tax=Rutidosis leptorrhynchoides TaxID=125765 RepID=UPI003A997A03